jgi:small-conductance mechanosensitive channel
MHAAHRDQIVGSLLLIFGAVWTAVVYLTVPQGFGDGIGPRAFPLFLGILLVFLSALLLISGFRKARAKPEQADEEDGAASTVTRTDVRMVGSVFVIIIAYGFLMQKVGFEIATLAVVTTTMWLVLGIRKPITIIAMAVGLTAGCWLVFGQILGAYLPPGTWLSLF